MSAGAVSGVVIPGPGTGARENGHGFGIDDVVAPPIGEAPENIRPECLGIGSRHGTVAEEKIDHDDLFFGSQRLSRNGHCGEQQQNAITCGESFHEESG